MMAIYYASNAVQSIAGIQFFKDADYVFGVTWRVIKRIARVISFIIAMCIGAAVPLTIMAVVVKIMVAD